MKLTRQDVATLDRARALRDRYDAGIFPATIGDVQHFRKLERMGLLAFDNYGRDIDRETDRDVPVYQLTAIGRTVLADHYAARGIGV